ncbi:60 kDa SS-A/Ro ribonucleoprotein isoform X1 [Lampris incognitus]|uniref:60 kDa SS-A/Ro ribonucleoprotein isoform X1 n=1 Tax=Lampris incognitus TaxID=2546036 RepID=UPI0024B4F8F3|nr:60 kDa SS-A/Ro ribonucleoprotein isoform X1 [Lampris incognitus]
MEPSGSIMTASPSGSHNFNSAGSGCPLELSDKVKLCRFLCFCSEGDIYTAREEHRLGMESSEALLTLLQEGRGCEVVEEIKRFAQDERAVRLNACLFALAVCSQHSELKTRQAAFKALKEVCRIPIHLFSFIQYKKELKEGMKCGIWGRALRKAVSNWYNEQDAMSLAVAVTKCKQREGWSHKDLLRLSHARPAYETIALISKYVTKGWKEVQVAYADKENSEEIINLLSYLEVVEKVKHPCDETEVIHLIEEHRLEREQLLTDHLKSKQVWRALLKEMPLESMLRILGKMTADKILESGSSEMATICDRIQSEALLKKNVEPVNKRFAVAVDVSSSLCSVVPGTSVSTVIVAAAITMVISRTEMDTQVLIYSEGAVFPCTITADMSLVDVTTELVKIPSGSTDCTIPITWATENRKAVDMFVVLTNNPLWTFSASPVETLRKHRQQSGIFSKLVMCGLTSIGHAIADTEDRGLLNICGFDLGAVNIIRNLAQDLI